MDALPRFEMLDWDLDAIFHSQASSSKYSHLTPLGSQQSGSAGRNASNISINLPDSSHGSFGLPGDFGSNSPAVFKPFQLQGHHTIDLDPFGDDDQLAGVALEIDADGNLIGIFGEEPELPPFPGPPGSEAAHVQLHERGSDALLRDLLYEDEPFLLGEEAILPDAQPFPTNHQEMKQPPAPSTSDNMSSEADQATAPSRRARRRKATTMLDEKECLSRHELKSLTINYLDNMDQQRKRRKTTSIARAKQNAVALIFGNGLAGVGFPLDDDSQIAHPLAKHFAGDGLRASLFGLEVPDEKPKGNARRRGRSAAFDDDDDDDQQREVKQRKQEAAEIEQFLNESQGLGTQFADELAPELGMDEVGALADRHSSTLMPWSRAGSVIPGSSVRGSAKKPSPMPIRAGSVIQSIERHSDIGDIGWNETGGQFASNDS